LTLPLFAQGIVIGLSIAAPVGPFGIVAIVSGVRRSA
jgi:hypothetical protein